MQRSHQDIAIDPNLISARAYEIWQSMGCPEGVADKTWLEAEKQLRASLEPQSIETARSSEPVSESMLKAHVQRSDPALEKPHEELDSATMAAAAGKNKKVVSASGGKRNHR